MASTAIVLTNKSGIFVPSQPSVSVMSGDKVTFSTKDGTPAYLSFSPDAVKVLSPSPVGPVAVSALVEFTFTSSAPGAYSVFFETTTNATIPEFPVSPSGLLLLEIDTTGVNFGTPDNRTKGFTKAPGQ